MKNFYKTISRRLILSILILISCVFLTGLSIAPEEVPVPQAEPSVSAPPPPPETPQDGAVIDHPLPEDPILTKGPLGLCPLPHGRVRLRLRGLL